MEPILDVCWLGSVEYGETWALQERLAGEIASGFRRPTLLLLEHPHTYTFGRRGEAAHLLWDEATLAEKGVSVHWVDRGGDVTYHGPGQLVGYPLLPLAPAGWQQETVGGRIPQADFVGYVRKLEEVLIHTLAHFGLVSAQRPGLTGVWMPAEAWAKCLRCDPRLKPAPVKIASIGVKVDARGVSRHGFALNVAPDASYWEGIIACGLDGVTMASMADFLASPPSVEETARVCARAFADRFEMDLEWRTEGAS
jgi:lipoyl(octanoyl) transferase